MDFQTTLLLALVAGAFAGPAGLRLARSPSTCSLECTASSKFSYAPGTTYQFKYEAETKTSMLGVSKDHSTIGIFAKADVKVISKCEFLLKLRDVQLFGYDSSTYKDEDNNQQFATTLEQYPLSFSFQDGTIESVCPDDQEVSWALNIKKGILSSFQNTMEAFEQSHSGTENDVTGSCDVQYTVTQQGWRSLTIKKTKDLSTCSNRNGYETAIQTTPFRISSGLKALPLLKSSYECDHVITTDGILTSVVCHEMHIFRPFSKDTSGAATETTQKLTFLQHVDSIPGDSRMGDRRVDLFFDQTQGETEGNTAAREALDLLRNMCRETADDIRPDTPRQFSSLVSIMKTMNYNGLKRVYNQVKNDRLCPHNTKTQKFAMDAFPMIGTGASVQLMKELISNDAVTGVETDLWLASLAFIHNPTKEILRQIKDLMGLSALASKVVLPFSAMLHSYCRLNPECGQVSEFQEIIQALVQNIPTDCVVDQQNYKLTLLTLRALSNTGHAQLAVPTLEACFSRKENPMDVRVSAVDAFRRLSCGAERNNLMLTYRNSENDPELRVTAYLGVMRCPTTYFIDQIMETLKNEEVNQVGSFVWSHLTNLIESSDPANKLVQSLLPDAIELREFDMDMRKFSRNYEGSFFIEKFNTGAKIDSNLIWSGVSFIPRSASVNLTFDLFGESLNLFEVGGRVEGLEHLLESYFGPMGYYKGSERQTPESVDPRKADLSLNKIDRIRNQAASKKEELRGAMYMRMFGNELSYTMFGKDADESSLSLSLFDIFQKLRRNENQDISLVKSMTFLDSSIIVPTLAGLPLNLTVLGTASSAIKTTGHMDLKQPKTNIVIEGSFEPSGAVEIQSMMSVDAHVTHGGLKMVSNLHTSTGVKAKVEINNKQILNINFDLTKDKSEIFSVQSSLFMVYRDSEKELTAVDELSSNYLQKERCADQSLVSKITGLTICAEMKMPNATGKVDAPYFPLTGPAAVSLYLQKRDVPNGYKLEAKSIHNPQQTLLRFVADTPGSTTNRAIGLDVVLGRIDKTVTVNLNSPWKTVTFNGNLLDTANVKGVHGKAVVDKEREYITDVKIQLENTNDRWTYTPTIVIQIPNYQNIEMSGAINYMLRKKLDVDFSISGVQDHLIEWQSTLLNTEAEVGATGKFHYVENQEYELIAVVGKKIVKRRAKTIYLFTPKVYVKTPTEEVANLTGSLHFIPDKSLQAALTLTEVTRKAIIMKADFTKTFYKKRDRTKYLGKVNIQAPGLLGKVVMQVDKRNTKAILSKARIDYNLGKGVKETIMINNKVLNRTTNAVTSLKIINSINFVKSNDYDSNLVIDFSHKQWLTSMEADLEFGSKLGQKFNKKKMNLDLSAKHRLRDDSALVNYTVGFRFPLKDLDILLKGGHQTDDRNVESQISLRYHPQRTVQFGVKLHNKTQNSLPYLAGHTFMVLPDNRELELGGYVRKMAMDRYGSGLEFALQKGRRSRIETEVKIATNHTYEFNVKIMRPENDPVQVAGAFFKEENGFTVSAKYLNGSDTYSSSLSTVIIRGESAKVVIDFVHPERHVTLDFKGSYLKTERNGLIDIKWDADRDLDQRFLFNTTLAYDGPSDVEVSSVLHYPSRTIAFKLKHSIGDRYISNVELSWDTNKLMKAGIIFRNDELNGAGRTELSVEFAHPFSNNYNDLSFELSRILGGTQHQTKASMTWTKNGKEKKILISTTVKVPVSFKHVDLIGTITTPFEDYEGMTASLNVRFDENPMTSNLLVQWGRKRIVLNTESLSQSTRTNRIEKGKWEIHTPFKDLRGFVVTWNHTSDGSVFTTNLQVEKDLERYMFDMNMNHAYSALQLRNYGTLQISVPFDNIDTTWNIENRAESRTALLDIKPSRGNHFKVLFQEEHHMLPNRRMNSKFELEIPTESLRHLEIAFDHEDNAGYIKTLGNIKKDGFAIFSSGLDYENRYGNTNLDIHFASPFNEDVALKMTSSHALMPYNSHAEFKWAPFQEIIIDSTINHNEFGILDHSVRLTTPFQGFTSIFISTSRRREDLNWVAKTEINLGNQQKIVFSSLYRFDHVKLTSISLQTPFPRFPGFETSFKIDGSPVNFRGDAAFIMQPYVGRTTVDFNWAYYSGTTLSGEFNLNTQHPRYPYMKARVNSNLMGASRISSAEVEYLPTQVIKVDTNYRFTSAQTLEGTITVASPFTEGDLVAGFKHTGNRKKFDTNAKITCDCFSRPVFADASFSALEAIALTFNMDSPFSGYETTKLTFNHNGPINNFHTLAEYETNGDKITMESMLKLKRSYEGKFSFQTPFEKLSKAELQFLHKGNFPNIQCHGEAWYNKMSMISDLALTHSTESSHGSLTVNTPLEKYRTLKVEVTKAGPLHDLSVDTEVIYGPTITGTLRHKYGEQDLSSTLSLKAPGLLPDDFNMYIYQQGPWNDRSGGHEITMGKVFNFTRQALFNYEGNTIQSSYIEVNSVGNETMKTMMALNHMHNIKSYDQVLIKSNLVAERDNMRAAVDLEYMRDFQLRWSGTEIASLIVELPIKDYSYNKYVSQLHQVMDDSHIYYHSKDSFETPLLDTLSREIQFNSSGLSATFSGFYHVSYGPESQIQVETKGTPGTNHFRIATPYKRMESLQVETEYNYQLEDFRHSMEATLQGHSPAKIDLKCSFPVRDLADFSAEAQFTSPIENFERLHAAFAMNTLEHTYKPHVEVSWTDDKSVVLDGNYQMNAQDGVFTSGISMTSPFEAVRRVNVQTENLYNIPIRGKSVMLVEHNRKKLFDTTVEVSFEKKISTIVMIRAPRPMEFSISALNDGENVDSVVLLNWNKAVAKSQVTLEIGYGDTGDSNSIKKDIKLRFAHPERIVGLLGNFKWQSEEMTSMGKITWDEKAGKEASYDWQYGRRHVRHGQLYDSTATVRVPDRTMEMSASFRTGPQTCNFDGKFFWDVDTDTNKQINVQVSVVETSNVKKNAQVEIHLPSFGKDLIVNSDATVNDGTTLFDGTTEISYSNEENKKISLRSTILEKSGPGFSVQWSVKHPYTKTDIQMRSSLGQSDSEISCSSSVKYLTADQGNKDFTLSGSINKQNKQLNVEVTSPSSTAGLTGQFTTESPYTVTMATSRNSIPTWKSMWKVDTVNKNLEASMTYEEGNMKKTISTRAFFPNETAFSSETTRETGSESIQEGQLTGYLNSSRILHGRISWRPDMLIEIARFAGEAVNRSSSDLASVLSDVSEDIGSELSAKYVAIGRSLSQELSPFSRALADEINNLQRELTVMRRELRRMYKKNDLYLKTMEEVYSGAVESILQTYSVAISKARTVYSQIETKVERLTKQFEVYPIQEKYNAFINQASEALQSFQEQVQVKVDLLLQEMADKLAELSGQYEKYMTALSTDVKQAIMDFVDENALEPYMEDLREAYEKVLVQYPELYSLRDTDVKAILMKVHSAMLAALEKSTLPEKYNVLYQRTSDVLNEQFGNMMKNQDFRNLHEALNEVYNSSVWIYKSIDVNNNLKDVLDMLIENVRNRVIAEFNQLPIGLLDMHKSRFSTFDLDNGEIEFDLYLPVPMENFDQLTRFKIDNYLKRLRAMADKYFPRLDFCMWDWVYQFWPIVVSPEGFIPPFDAYGLVSGEQHFTTFDGRHYDFAGLCSYVLAEDTVDRNFTVVQKYTGYARNPTRHSLVVMTLGMIVELSPDYMVKINGQPTELPYHQGGLGIIRVGQRILLNANVGLDIIANFDKDFHIIGISGWYFGKTGGLLGTYDYEQYNEMRLPNGVLTNDARDLANVWEVADSCRSRRNFAIDTESQKNPECTAAFEATSSSLRPCFLQVEPESFQHSCNMEPHRLCDIAALYVSTCARNRVNIQIPQSCVQCSTPNSRLLGSEDKVRYSNEVPDENLHNSVDTVFVVEERQCNRDVATKLSDIIYKMERNLERTGTQNNRYSLIGYAGSSVASHTMEGQIFNEAQKFTMGIESLRFENLGPYADPLSAIMKATALPFRAGVRKMVVLVSCSVCAESSGYTYSALGSVLWTRDITLHVLRQSALQLTENRAPKTNIYGIKSEAVITEQTSHTSEKDLFSEIEIPSDYCAALALRSNGSLFDVSHVLRGTIRQQREFITTLGQEIGNAVDDNNVCQECACELDQYGEAVTVCRTCNSVSSYMTNIPKILQSTMKLVASSSDHVKTMLSEFY